MMSHLRGVVFDLDGVLMHSTACHRTAFEQVLASFGITDFEYARYAGWRTREVCDSEFRRCGIAATEEQTRAAAERKTELARQMMIESNPIADGCLPVLARLAESYRLALASSGSRGSVYSFLDVNDCRKFFSSVLTGDDIVRSKPDPEIYRKSFAALDLAARECAVVEDAVAGLAAARDAGARTIGITGTCSAETLQAAGADRIVETLEHLPDTLVSL